MLTRASQINLTMLEDLPIPAPSLPEQRAIAHILGTLDDKIELNRRMNATLEAMARALFQSWFVDFDPVRAKLDGRQTPGLTQPPPPSSQHFEDSALGHTPEGWGVRSLDRIAQYLNGLALQKYPPEQRSHTPGHQDRSTPQRRLRRRRPLRQLIFRPNTSSMTATCFSLGLAASKLSSGAAAPAL